MRPSLARRLQRDLLLELLAQRGQLLGARADVLLARLPLDGLLWLRLVRLQEASSKVRNICTV